MIYYKCYKTPAVYISKVGGQVVVRSLHTLIMGMNVMEILGLQ